MLFRLKGKEDVFKLNPELEAIPEFCSLTDRQMKYIILSFDYKSPMRALKPEKRRERAAYTAGYKYEKDGKRLDSNGRAITSGKVARVEKAVIVYKSLQRDEDRENLDAINALIEQIRKLAKDESKSPNDLKKSVELSKQIPDLLEIRKRIANILELRDEIVEADEDDNLVDEEELSTLERLNSKI